MTDKAMEELFEFLRIPSISTNPHHKADIVKCANHLKDYLTTIGLEHVTIYETEGHPIVYADYIHSPNAPTILYYGHYDVQPPEPLDLWTSPPFEPEIRDGYIYARGASDDKGQVYCQLQALQSLIKEHNLHVNVKMIIEGEEEIGSHSLKPFLHANKDLLSADIALISDTPMYNKEQPSLCIGLRGMLYTELTVTGPNRDLHSGQLGGVTQNPIQALSNIISALKDDNQMVLIPGFYDTVFTMSDDLRQMIQSLPFDAEALKANLQVNTLVGEADYTPNERMWFRPTLDCNGIFGGYTGEGAKTIIPSKATAKISMRLVANQDPNLIFEKLDAYIKHIQPVGVTTTLRKLSVAKPAMVDTSSPYIAAGLKALEDVHQKPAIMQGEGGTIPVVNDFKSILNIDTILMGFNLPDDNIHSPNERFGVDNFKKGIASAKRFYELCKDLK